LTYIPKACKCCGCVNDGSIVKNGTKLTHPLLLDMAGCPTYLELKKQRFLCRECGQTFIAETTMVKNGATSRMMSTIPLQSRGRVTYLKRTLLGSTVYQTTPSIGFSKPFITHSVKPTPICPRTWPSTSLK